MLINVVGLVPELMGPRLRALAARGWQRSLSPVFPAVTCTAQATMLSGAPPREHGIVANGWYFRELSEVWFWRQSHALLQAPMVWDSLRAQRKDLRVAQMFWWFNMYSSAEFSVTPRPEYPADGRKIPGVYTQPPELRAALEARLGVFPLFRFWGPATDLSSTSWIVDASLQVLRDERPDLLLAYLPHLDYVLQREGPRGPNVAADVAAVDTEVGRLLDAADEADMEVLVVSEYGIGEVTRAVHPNRALREAGLLRVLWQDAVGETLDAGASRAFAVCDHQAAHVYVADPADRAAARRVLEALPGVAHVHEGAALAELGLDHPRSGELVLESEADAWFAYPFWLDDARAPDYARTVDIHRKPGYDPAELLLDPALASPKLRIARRLLARKLGFRNLLDVTPLDASLVRGSHGHRPKQGALWPVAIGSPGLAPPDEACPPLSIVHDLVHDALSDSPR
ncbi:MAG: alkaline phosphatase family protein [Planctomycetota bacterium]|nr:MAG: alkaline phosphatase family protein [Planctomycetota bacterium]